MTTPLRVLLAEDEEHLGAILESFLAGRGHQVVRVGDGRTALDALRDACFDVALLDVMMPELDGIEVLRAIASLPRQPEAVIITGNATADVAGSALQLGAYGCVTKPYRMADVDAVVRRAAERGRLRRAVARLRERVRRLAPAPAFVTAHPPLASALAAVPAVRPGLVLLTGEPGAGRASIARWLHERSAWAEEPLAEPAGADRLVEAGEAVLLRDADRLDAGAAAALRAALDAGAPARVYATVAVAPAWAADLAIAQLTVPPLRERTVDIRPLAEHLLEEPGTPWVGARLDAAAAAWLERQRWPGNVAELRAVLALAALRAAGGTVGLAALGVGAGAHVPSDPV